MKKLILFLVVLNLITFGQTAEEYFKNGFSKYNLKDYSGAIVDYNNAIRLNPNYADAYHNRGISKANIDDYAGAIIDYNKVIQLNPNYADVYHNRGISKYLLHDLNGACLDWKKAGELGQAKAYEKINKYCK